MPRASLATTYRPCGDVPDGPESLWGLLGVALTLGGLWLVELLEQISLSSLRSSSSAEACSRPGP